MGSISKKLHFKILLKIFVKKVFREHKPFLVNLHSKIQKITLFYCEFNDHEIFTSVKSTKFYADFKSVEIIGKSCTKKGMPKNICQTVIKFAVQ
jgi:hypothetical protein